MKQIFFIVAILFFAVFLGFSQQKPANNMKKALVLIDIQNDYFENGSMTLVGAGEACINARKILDKFRSEGLPVIYIQHLAISPKATFFLPQTKGAEIHENIKPTANEKIIVKNYPNSFRETELLEYMKSKDISNLVICGMMTHMCVDATVRAAKDFGFNCVVISDACATRDLVFKGETVKAPEVQKSFLAALNGFYASVNTTKQYLEGK